MSFSPTSRQIVLQEVFDEASVPTDEEIHDYALKIGINVETEPHLFYLARDGLMQALPPGWKPCYDEDKKEIYYFNFKTGKAQWEHPLDDVYRNLVKKARTESAVSTDQMDEDSRTSIKEDLKSFEEASLILPSSEMYPKPRVLEPLSPIGRNAFKKSPPPLSSLNKSLSKELLKNNTVKSPAGLDDDTSAKKSIVSDDVSQTNKIVFNDTEVKKRPNSSDIRNRRNIGPMEFRHLSKQDIITPKSLGKINFLTDSKKLSEQSKTADNQNENKTSDSTPVTRDEGYATEFSVSSLGEKDNEGKKELTLTGGGSIFLKTNKNKSSPSSDLISPSFSKEELTDGLLSPAEARRSSSDIDSHPKGILREQKSQKSIEEQIDIIIPKKSDIDDERKSVRFDLEKELKINFEIRDITSSESEENISSSDRKKNDAKSGLSKFLRENKEEDARQIEIDFEDLEIGQGDPKLEKENQSPITEDKVPNIPEQKTVEPKKFKSSQSLIKEFRDIFEVKSKPKIIPRTVSPINRKDSDIDQIKSEEIKSSQNSSRSGSSQNDDKSSSLKIDSRYSSHKLSDKNDKIDNLIDLSELEDSRLTNSTVESQKITGRSEKNMKLKDEIFDSDFGSLVDFAIKKKLFEKDLSEKTVVTKRSAPAKTKSIFKDKDLIELEQILKNSESFASSQQEKGIETSPRLIVSDRKLIETLDKESNENIEDGKEIYEKNKIERLKLLDADFNIWLANVTKSFEEKKKETLIKLENDFETWKRDQENEHLEKKSIASEEVALNKMKEIRNEFLKNGEEEMEKLKAQLKEEQNERLKNLKTEIEIQELKELESLKKSFEQNLNEKKLELMKKHKEELVKMERNLEDMLSEQRSQKLKELEIARENEAAIEVMRLELKENYQKQKTNLIKEHESLLENLRQEHVFAIEQLKIEMKNEEEALRKMHMNRIEEKKLRLEGIEGRKMDRIDIQRPDTTDARVFEKVRCEKRLLEDKYKTLKEKYIRLKTEAKMTLERKKKKEGGATTGSETEKSSSYKTNPIVSKSDYDSPSARRKYETDKKLKLKKQITNLDNVNQNISTEDEANLLSPKNLATQLSPNEFRKVKKSPESIRKQKRNEEKQKKLSIDCEKSRDESSGMVDSLSGLSGDEKKNDLKDSKKKRQLFSRLKAASTSRLNFNNRSQEKEDCCLSPVENLRRQLKKLEELEDQFPVTTYTDTYMRYPFTDNPQFGSSEIEFFKHRIHLERESVRRAKESLKAQKKCFENRQRELKQRLIDGGPGSKSVIEQIYQEEKELTDMEVSVHRTRALLGEKIIRLRHLEQSLRRISQPRKKDSFSVKNKDLLGRLGVKSHSKDDDGTLSDLSSHSGSSGFSSTDFNVSDTHNVLSAGGNRTNLEQNRRHFQNNMQESSEIIQSLENLNSEIREIWEVLKKQHQSGQGGTVLPPPPLIYSDLGWPAFSLSPPLPFRNTVITSSSNVQRPVAQQYKTQVTASSNLGHITTVVDSSLIDRTRSLRDWLKAARSSSSPSDVISPNQTRIRAELPVHLSKHQSKR